MFLCVGASGSSPLRGLEKKINDVICVNECEKDD
jgi:hypothetical protein